MIEVDSSSLREKLKKTTYELIDNARIKAYKLADYYLMVIKERTPKKTGATANSWTIHYHKNDLDGVVWEISPDGKEDIVRFLEQDTKPHIILPKDRDGVLVFEKGGEIVFTKRVFHPGTKGRWFVKLTQDELDKETKEIADRLISRIRSIWL